MSPDSEPRPPDVPRCERLVSFLVGGTVILGLLLPWLFGIVAGFVLRANGHTETGLHGGMALLLVTPVTIIPFVILTLIIRRVLTKIIKNDRDHFSGWYTVSFGAIIGLAIATVLTLIEPVQASKGPGDPFGMMLALWPITIPMQIVFGCAGCVAGGLAGAIVGFVRTVQLSPKE